MHQLINVVHPCKVTPDTRALFELFLFFEKDVISTLREQIPCK